MIYSKMKNFIVLFAQLCLFSVQGQPDVDIPEQDILDNIFNMYSYNNLARPAPSTDFVVNVGHSLTLVAIDMVDNMLIADTWQAMTWNDLRLQWVPIEYRRLRQINIVDDQIWTPDILLYNNAAANSGRTYKSIRCIVDNNGGVLWVPPTRVTAYCNDVNPSKDPSGTFMAGDKHCSLKFGSWTYNKDQLDMYIDGGLILDDYNESPKFKIINTTVEKVDIKYSCCPSLYASIIYNITLRPKLSGPQRDEPAAPVEGEDEEPVDDDDVKPDQDKLEAEDDDDDDDGNDDDDVGDDDGNAEDVEDDQDNAGGIDDNVDEADDDAILDDNVDDADNVNGGDVAGDGDADGDGDDDHEIIAEKVNDIGDIVQKAEKPESPISPIFEKQEDIDDDHKPLMD